MSARRGPHDTGHESRPTAVYDVARHGARLTPMSDADCKRSRRNAAVVITDPHIVVVESATMADPAALDDALEFVVKWAVRARGRWHPVEGRARIAEASSARSQRPIPEAKAPVAQNHVPDATRAQAPDTQGGAPSHENTNTYRPGEMT